MRTVVKFKEEETNLLLKIRQDGLIKFIRINFNNYFYIKEEDYGESSAYINKFAKEIEHVEMANGSFVKIVLRSNFMRPYLKKALEENFEIETFEADITSGKRFLIDHQEVKLNQIGLKKCWLDIETDDRRPLERDFKGNIVPNMHILSVALKDFDTGEETYLYNKGLDGPEFDDYRVSLSNRAKDRNNKEFKSQVESRYDDTLRALSFGEKILLSELYKILKEYDAVLAWNGKRFDFLILQGRMKLYDLDYYLLFLNDLDYMDIYKKNTYQSLKSYKLERVGFHEYADEINKENSLIKGIEEVMKTPWQKITKLKKYFELFVLYPELMREYNIQDDRIMVLIEKKIKLLFLHNVLCDICHCMMQDTVYNSFMVDYLFLNEYKRRNLVAPSAPRPEVVVQRKDPLGGEFIGGGFTFCFLKGLHDKLNGYDLKSDYPLTGVTYNIDLLTYLGNFDLDLGSVFNNSEIDFITKVFSLGKSFLDSKGKLKKEKYEKAVEELRVSIEKEHELEIPMMQQLMWKFIKGYDNSKASEEAKRLNCIVTPADINYDTRGWAMHPHRFYLRDVEGVFPKTGKFLIQKRDEVKYILKQFEEGSAEWWEKYLYQLGLKYLGNSSWGVFGSKIFRFYKYDVADSITTSARYTTKRAILMLSDSNLQITHGDTDSVYCKGELDVKEINCRLYDLWNEMIKPFNTSCKIEHKNPRTGNLEVLSHFIRMEYEKTFESAIVLKKKRYYGLIDGKVKLTGVFAKKSDTLKIAAEMSVKMAKEIMEKTFDDQKWFDDLKVLREKVFSNKLEEEHLIKVQGVSKDVSEYGKPVIDGNTGLQKARKSDGVLMFAPIPAHIKIALKMKEQGEDIETGQRIEYIVKSSDPIVPISVEDYRHGEKYDAEYYWEKIYVPLLEIIDAIYPEECFGKWNQVWGFTERQLKKLRKDQSASLIEKGGRPDWFV